MASTPGSLVQRLADIEEIKQLKARYFRFLDTKRWDGFRSVFTPDLRVNIAESRSNPTNREELVASVERHLQRATTVHHGHMPEIDVVEDTHATGTWAMFDFVEMPPDSDRPSFRGFGHYVEEYRKVDGQWLISSLRLTRIRVDTWAAADRATARPA